MEKTEPVSPLYATYVCDHKHEFGKEKEEEGGENKVKQQKKANKMWTPNATRW